MRNCTLLEAGSQFLIVKEAALISDLGGKSKQRHAFILCSLELVS